MTVNSMTSSNAASGAAAAGAKPAAKTGMAALGSTDFLRLMTVQMQQQDPFNPMDQTQMLAQMAQFSTLAANAESGDTLKQIASKMGDNKEMLAALDGISTRLDTLIAAQAPAQGATDTTSTQEQ